MALPLAPQTPAWIDSLLFLCGATRSFFVPLLGALVLGLAGHQLLNRVMGGTNARPQFCLLSGGACALLAGASVILIREPDLDERIATGRAHEDHSDQPWTRLLRDRAVLLLFLSIFLFHFANAPILPTVALYVKKLGGSDKLMTPTVLTAQIVMTPVAWLSGGLCDLWAANR